MKITEEILTQNGFNSNSELTGKQFYKNLPNSLYITITPVRDNDTWEISAQNNKFNSIFWASISSADELCSALQFLKNYNKQVC